MSECVDSNVPAVVVEEDAKCGLMVTAAGGESKALMEMLSAEQRQSLDVLRSGKNVMDAAEAAGVARTTVYRWLKTDGAFKALYNAWREETEYACRGRLTALTGKATAALEKAIEGGDSKLAFAMLKGMGLITKTPPLMIDAAQITTALEIEQRSSKLRQKKQLYELSQKEQEDRRLGLTRRGEAGLSAHAGEEK